LLAECGLGESQEQQVFDALQRKSLPDLQAVLADLPSSKREKILQLASLHGGAVVLEQVSWADDVVQQLRAVADAISSRYPEVKVYFDLGELRGYHYHTGLVFAAYVDGHGQAVANGGRYDDVGQVFGRARPATGFNTDLKALLQLLSASLPATCSTAICAPAQTDAGLWQRLGELRAAGEIVITSLSGEIDPRCDRQLVCRDGEWEIEPVRECEL
jgi:ATP phosphoribosyltransferase regulatory subunit